MTCEAGLVVGEPLREERGAGLGNLWFWVVGQLLEYLSFEEAEIAILGLQNNYRTLQFFLNNYKEID